ELYHLAPFLGFVSDELAEFRRRAPKRPAAKFGEPRLHYGVGESGVDLIVEFISDLGGRGLWQGDAMPPTRLVTRQEHAHGRDVWHRVRAGRGGDSERAQLAGSDVPDGTGQGGKVDLHLPTEQIGK